MLRDGDLPQSGLIKQEEIGLEAFLANRFGRVYATRRRGVERRLTFRRLLPGRSLAQA